MRRAAPLAGVLLLAAALRLAGLGWGLPAAGHYASYHPDEWNTLRSLGNMRPASGDFNPRNFHNPTLFYYACGASFAAARVLGLIQVPLQRDALRARPDQLRRLYLVGRGLSVLAGLATVALVWAVAAQLGGRRAGLVAALLMAVAPGPVVLSHYMDLDAPLAALTTATLGASLVLYRRPSLGWALVAGALCGLAAATKYNGILVLPVAAVAALAGPGRRLPRMLLVLAAALAAFLLATPYALLDRGAFLEGVRFVLFQRAALRWSQLGHGAGFTLLHTWRWGLGTPLLILLLTGALGALVSRRLRFASLLLGGYAAAVYSASALTGTDYLRYSLPALPALAILTGVALAGLERRPWRELAQAATGLAALHALTLSLAWVGLMASPDVRDRASSWLAAELPAGSRVAVPRQPYFHSPAIIHTQYAYNRPGSPFEVPDLLRVIDLDWRLQALDPGSTPLVILSEYELLYPAAHASPNVELLEALYDQRQWRERARFEQRPELGGWTLERSMPGPGWPYNLERARALALEGPPHDLKYLNPTVLVLEANRQDASDPASIPSQPRSGSASHQPTTTARTMTPVIAAKPRRSGPRVHQTAASSTSSGSSGSLKRGEP